MKQKNIIYIKPDFEKRFKRSFRSKNLSNYLKRTQDNLVISNQLAAVVKPISSINHNNWLLDTRTNIETISSNIENIKNYGDRSTIKYCFSLLNDGRKYEDILISCQNKNYNHIFNYFLKSYSISKTIEDPLSKIILDDKYKAHYFEWAGYGPSIKEKYRIPIDFVLKDSQNSILGETILEEKQIRNYEKKINGYKLTFEAVDSDFRGFSHSRSNDLKLFLDVSVFGYQKINNIKITSPDNLIINKLYYIDNNQSLIEITDFEQVEAISTLNIFFSDIVTNSLKIEFLLKIPKDILSTDRFDSRIYSVYIKNISLYYCTYNNITYIDSLWINQNNLGSVKFNQLLHYSSDDFLIENYLLVDSFKEKKIFLINENYNDWLYSSLFFINKKANLFFIPSELEIYKNDLLLEEGEEYELYSSLSDGSILLSDLDYTKSQYLSIQLKEYDPTAFYYVKYKVLNNTINVNNEFYNQDSIVFSKPFATCKIKFITCFRKKAPKINKIPIIKSLFIRTTHVSQ